MRWSSPVTIRPAASAYRLWKARHCVAWPMLVDLWASYNRYLVHVIRHLPAAKLEVVCRIGSNAPVSLRYLAEDYVRHLVHHLDRIGVTTQS